MANLVKRPNNINPKTINQKKKMKVTSISPILIKGSLSYIICLNLNNCEVSQKSTNEYNILNTDKPSASTLLLNTSLNVFLIFESYKGPD